VKMRSSVMQMSPAVIGVGLLLALVGAAPALAEGSRWEVTSTSQPTNFQANGKGTIVVLVTNVGDLEANAEVSPVTVTDKLPSGLEVISISGQSVSGGRVGEMTCALSAAPSPLVCGFADSRLNMRIAPYGDLEVRIKVQARDAKSGEENQVTVEGGETPGASIAQPITVSSSPPQFGIERFELMPENEDGSPDTQAGSHPFSLTTMLALNTKEESGFIKPVALPKDLRFALPPGVVGDADAVAQCTAVQFTTILPDGSDLCAGDTAVGVATVTIVEPHNIQEPQAHEQPIFNLVPSAGEPARFGFTADGFPVTLNTSVRTGRDYGVTVSVENITQTVGFISSRVTFWGVPGDPRHNLSRGSECLLSLTGGPPCVAPARSEPTPFLTLPTSCVGPFGSSVEGDPWPPVGGSAEPSVSTSYTLQDSTDPSIGIDGCNRLEFNPTISVVPDGLSGSSPTGLAVDVHVPQDGSLNPTGLDEADVKDTTVTLPRGVQLSPSAANGLQACSNAQIGFMGVDSRTVTDEFTSELPTPLEPGVNFCPDASKLGTVNIRTPLLPHELTGAVYLAAPQNFAGIPQNPFESLIAMYIVAWDPVSGVLVKLPGKVAPDPVTGQLVSTFENTPQLPFEELKLHFFGGERAPLTTPALCGSYSTEASFTPWSTQVPGDPSEVAHPSSSFDITSNSQGALCSDPRPFSPGFQAGSTNLQAGAFTPFTLTMTRPDIDQTLGRVEMQMPSGLSGTLSDVKLCGEAQANAGTCGPESLIGETVVSAGLGNDPYTVTGGKVYITTGYKGAPFGLSIVNPAAAGPFILDEGRPVVVRAQIFVDPHTAALRIVSDPLPTILDGIPLQLQHVNVSIDREKFTFNPTSCNKTAINGTLSSSEGASAAVSTSFQVTNCATLKFAPKFAVSTSARTSKAKGASLSVKLTYPKTPQGSEANIAKVKVDLPKQLPSRLTTLQKACTAKVFEANPANCPAASIVGHAKAITPIIPVALEGPAYFVSHGGEAFPSLIVVLQGAAPYGVTVDLVGTTFISKAGITSSTFKSVPDVPVGTFELTLPQGKYSALAANLPAKTKGNFCGQKLAMPTAFVPQNGGAEIHETTKITVSGCPKHPLHRNPPRFLRPKKRSQRKVGRSRH
jgi:uncharacterized repeat protein (TIGR01451 family)